MQIVAMAGLAQCGKTTLAKEIARIAYDKGMRPRMMSFAAALKEGTARMGVTKEGTPSLYRKLLQQVGGFLRDPLYVEGTTNPDWWVNLTAAEVKAVSESEPVNIKMAGGAFHENVLIFDDVRFPNELALLKKLGAVLIYVDREEEIPDPNAEWRRDVSERMAYHYKSDVQARMDTFQYTVVSSGNMDSYLTRVRPFVPVWLGLEVLGIPRFPENH